MNLKLILISIIAGFGIGSIFIAPQQLSNRSFQTILPLTIPDNVSQSANESKPKIPDGHQVVRVSVSSDDCLSGLLKPGDRVDLLGLTSKDDKGRTIAGPLAKRLTVHSVSSYGNGDPNKKAAPPHFFVSVIATDEQAEIIEGAGKNIKVVLVGGDECPDCPPGSCVCCCCCEFEFEPHGLPPIEELQIPDNHQVVTLKSFRLLEGKVQRGDKAALNYSPANNGKKQSWMIARDLIVFGIERCPQGQCPAGALPYDDVNVLVPNKLAAFIDSSNKEGEIKLIFAGDGGGCPDCSPGRMDCGACCGEETEAPIDWTSDEFNSNELVLMQEQYQGE